MECTNKSIFIFTVSQAAIHAHESYPINSTEILECRRNLQRLASGYDVPIVWVPAGHVCNERANNLARIGSETPLERPAISYGIVKKYPRL